MLQETNEKIKVAMLPSIRNPTKSRILDSTAWVPDSRYGFLIRRWDLDSGFQSLAGFRIRWAVSCIPESRIPQVKNPMPVLRISYLMPL